MNNLDSLIKNALLNNKKKSLLILLTIIIGVIYISWRFFFVMSWAINIQSIIWGLIVLWADFYGFFNLVTFSFETLNNRDLFEYFTIENPKENFKPSVDIFICTYNEDSEIVKKTAMAASYINYENKNVYILDDGKREEIAQIARQIKVNYITRETNEHFKAGNLNNALKQTNGDLIAIFDADHVPTKIFLERLIDYFQEDSVALVQTPQHFYNPDPFQRNLELSKFITNEQDLFFKVIQPGRSYWNATICCGTNWMARRSAIEDIGLIPIDTITEDMLTSIRLQEKGYRTLYHNEPLAAGLSAESVSEYIMQRNRWGRGTVQIYCSKNNPLLSKKLNFAQKICYMGSINYYFVGLARMIYLLAPCGFILFNLQSCVATIDQLLLFQLPYLVMLLGSYLFISGGIRKPFFTESYESIIAYDLALMLFYSFFMPNKEVKFRVTQKNISFEKPYFDYNSIFPMLIVLFVILECLFLAPICYYYEIRNFQGLMINLFWLIYNLLIMIMVIKVGVETPQKRRYTRIPVRKAFELRIGKLSHLIYSSDLSEGGALVYTKDRNLPFKKGDTVYFVMHEKTGNIEVEADLVDFYSKENKTFLRLRFINVNDEQVAALIKNIYSFNWRWSQ